MRRRFIMWNDLRLQSIKPSLNSQGTAPCRELNLKHRAASLLPETVGGKAASFHQHKETERERGIGFETSPCTERGRHVPYTHILPIYTDTEKGNIHALHIHTQISYTGTEREKTYHIYAHFTYTYNAHTIHKERNREKERAHKHTHHRERSICHIKQTLHTCTHTNLTNISCPPTHRHTRRKHFSLQFT